MDMLDQYLAAVGAQLPQDARDDIVAELRDTLLSRFEERESALGRRLDDDEREQILRSFGHPLAVATRYRPGPQALVGPDLFPYWLFAVRAGLAILAAICLLNLVVRAVSGSADIARAASQAMASFIGSGLTLVGSLTVAAAVCERYAIRPRYLDAWQVKDLAILRLSDPANWAAAVTARPRRGSRWRRVSRGSRERTVSSRLGSLAAGVVFVLWWLGVLHFPAVLSLSGGASADIAPAPVWTTLYPAILLYALAQIGADAFGLIRPTAPRLQAAIQAPLALAGLLLTWMIFQAGDWFTLVGADGARAVVHGGASLLSAAAWAGLGDSGRTLPDLAAALGVIFTWTLAAVAAGLILKLLAALWRAAAASSPAALPG